MYFFLPLFLRLFSTREGPTHGLGRSLVDFPAPRDDPSFPLHLYIMMFEDMFDFPSDRTGVSLLIVIALIWEKNSLIPLNGTEKVFHHHQKHKTQHLLHLQQGGMINPIPVCAMARADLKCQLVCWSSLARSLFSNDQLEGLSGSELVLCTVKIHGRCGC